MFFISSAQAQQIRDLINLQDEPEKRLQNSRVASANHLARRVAYELDAYYLPTDELRKIEVYDEDGEIRSYNIELISTLHIGVVLYKLMPAEANNNRIHLVFRGSKDSPAWCRTTETPAPGCESFYSERKTILDALCQAISIFDENCKLHLIISGHSLGGSDAQNCAAEVMQGMAECHKSNPSFVEFIALLQINKLSINHANSAGVSTEVANKTHRYAQYVSDKLQVKINVMCVFMAGDGVQQTGQNHILSDEDPSVAHFELVKLSSQYEGVVNNKYILASIVTLPFTSVIAAGYAVAMAYSAYKVHKLRFFDHSEFKSQNYTIHDNKSEDGRLIIRNRLAKHPLDNPLSKGTLLILHYAQYLVTKTKREHALEMQRYVIVDKKDCQEVRNERPSVFQEAATARFACIIQ